MEDVFRFLKSKNGDYKFVVTVDGIDVMKSDLYSSKEACHVAANRFVDFASVDNSYEKRRAFGGKFYFFIQATNGQVIATSITYPSEKLMNKSIDSVRGFFVSSQWRNFFKTKGLTR